MPKIDCPTCDGKKDVRANQCSICRMKYNHPRSGIGKYGVGRTAGVNGYIYTPNGLEHREVMAECLGRPLSEDEVVHHKNGERTDNQLENLEIMSVSDHKRMHMKAGKAKKMSVLGHKARWDYES